MAVVDVLVQLTAISPYLYAGLAWSPDGTRIAFSFSSASLGIVGADGSGLIQLGGVPGTLRAMGPAWSPDGTKIAFVTLPPYED